MNDKYSKVTSLGSIAAVESQGGAAGVIQSIQKVAESGVQRLLQALFDNADDALFELADRAESNLDQSCYFEAMREIRIKRQGMERCFSQTLANQFNGLIKGQFSESGLNDDAALAVVSNNELEERVAIESMVSKAMANFEQPLANLTTRLDSLVAGITITDAQNPLGPEALCQCFMEACQTLDLDIRAKLVLLKLYDRYVISGLNDLYQLCNQVLIERGILPGLNMADAKRQRVLKPGPQMDEAAIPTASGDVFTDLQTLLQAMPNHFVTTDGQVGLVAPGQAPQIPRQQLLQLLQRLQGEQQSQFIEQQRQALQGLAPRQIDIQQTLDQLLVAQMPGESLSIGQVDNDVINLVEMLFQFILDERNLAPPMKALLARLQIPFIKLAMLDKQFFSKGSHPARQLLNAVASACLGWEPPAETGEENGAKVENDRLYKKVDAVVSTISDEFDADAAMFEQLLEDFNHFIDAEERRAQLVQQRTLGAEEGKAKSDLAREQVQNLLDSKIKGIELPDTVRQLVEDGWSQVLLHTFLKAGSESPAWQEAVASLDELLWSVQPPADEASRQQLLKSAPAVIKALRNGLNTISYNPFELQQLFEAIEAIHLANLEADIAAEPPLLTTELTADELLSVKSTESKQPNEPLTLDQLLEQDQVANEGASELLASLDAGLDETLDDRAEDDSQTTEQIVNESSEASQADTPEIEHDENDPVLQHVDALAMGAWFELQQNQGSQCRCRLAAIIRATGKYIFVNRSGVKVAEYTRQSLAQAIKYQHIRQLDDGQLFDRALESVINDLRDKKSSQA